MKAITLWQPWATLVATGAKNYETRSWSTKYRGPLAIHAAKRKPEYKVLAFWGTVRDALDEAGFRFDFPLGAVVATCELVDVFPVEQIWHELKDLPFEVEFGDWSAGRFAWQLSNIKLIDPAIPARGSQGFWEWSNERS